MKPTALVVTAGAALLACLLGARTGTAHATLIDLGTITRDTNTNLDWLDLTATPNMPSSQVLANFPGFRYASSGDVAQFFDDAGVPFVSGTYFGQGVFDAATAFVDLIAGGGTHFSGLYDPSSDSIWAVSLNLYQPDEVYIDGQLVNFPRGGGPYFLVAPAPVPEPTMLLLFGTAMTGIGIARRRMRCEKTEDAAARHPV